jgi:hypothetical protein
MRKAIIIVLVLLIPAVVLGDLLIEEKVSSKGAMGMWESKGMETTYIKGDKVRTDSRTTVKGMMEAMMPKPEVIETHIVRLDRGVIWSMDPEESTYSEMSVQDMGAIGGEVESTMGVREITLSRTGDTRTIAGYECEGVLIEALIDVEAQGQSMTMNADALFWAAKEDKKLRELMKLWEGMMGLMDVREGGGFGSGMRALWDKFNEIEGVPLAMELTVDSPEAGDEEQAEEMKNAMRMMKEYMRSAGKEVDEEEEEDDQHFMVVTREVVSLEEASHDDAIFEIPDGFTKIGIR